jgi:putative transposase
MDYPELKEAVEVGIETISEWLGCEIKEKNVQKDHVHLIVSIPPKTSVSKYVGTIKGKVAIKIFQVFKGLKKQKYWGNHYWARGYFVSTVGIDEEMIRRYVKYQEKEEKKEEVQNDKFTLF